MKQYSTTLIPFEIIIFYCFLYGCSPKESVPFPEYFRQKKAPVSESFEYSEAKPIVWQNVNKDSIPQEKVIPFELEKLSWKSFTVNTFRPENEPVESIPLDWNKMVEYPINLDTVKTSIFSVKSFLLPKPEITKASLPSQLPGSTSGILQMGIEEGLPGNYIYETAIDNNGFIWMSTERGLVRYNGEFFECYDFLPKLSGDNPDYITDIVIDKENNLWMATQEGSVLKLNSCLDFVQYLELEDKIVRVALDVDGKLWYTAAEYGLGIINMEEQTIQRFVFPKSSEKETFYIGIKTDSEGNIWIGNREEIYVLNAGQSAYKILNNKIGLELSFVFGFYETKSGDIWIYSLENGAYSVSKDKDSIWIINEKQDFNGRVLAVAEDTAGKIWVIDNDTIFIHDPLKGCYKKIPVGVGMLSGTNVSSALIDSYGMLWVGTPQNKMLVIDPLGGLPEFLDMNDGLVSNNVWGIIEDREGMIWLGTYNGINIYDPVRNKLMLITAENGISHNRRYNLYLMKDGRIFAGGAQGFTIFNIESKRMSEFYSELYIQTFFDPNDGNIWLGGADGIFVFNMKGKTLKKLTKDMDTPLHVWGLQEDKDGRIWVGTLSAIYVIDPESDSISLFSGLPELRQSVYTAMHKTDNGEIWIGGDSGFSIINTDNHTVTHLSAEQGLYPEMLFDIAELNGRMYLGSKDGMVTVFPPKPSEDANEWKFYNYGRSNGYPFNDYNQNASAVTRNGQIWWGVSPQITVITQEPVINTKTPEMFITSISIKDKESDFIGEGYLKKAFTQIDTLWNNDLTEYYLSNTLPEDSGYFVKHNIKWDSISPLFHLPVGLELPYDQNSISFSFTNPEIRGRDKIGYSYFLEGIDQEWSRVSDQPFSRNYYNLKPGKYIFHASTRGFNNIWSNPAKFEFTILPPWWHTWWAYMIYIMFFLLLLRGYSLWRERNLRIEKEKLQVKVEEQTRELKKSLEELKSAEIQLIHSEKMASLGQLTAGIAHEIQNPLNFVNNFSDVNKELLEELKEEAEKGNFEEIKFIANAVITNEQKINHHGKRADSIVKGMLQHSRISTGQKEPTDINVLAEEYLRLSYHGMRAKDKSFKADYKTSLDPELPNINVVPQEIGRVLLNLINNGFYSVYDRARQNENGYKPEIILSTKKLDNEIEIRIQDNGKGIPQEIKNKIFQPFFTTKPTGQGTGLGLSLSYDIVKAHGGTISVKTSAQSGAEFIIKLPI